MVHCVYPCHFGKSGFSAYFSRQIRIPDIRILSGFLCRSALAPTIYHTGEIGEI